MQILNSTYYGKFYFEVAMILRDSLFLSSILLNSEAWVNYKENDIRILEQCDELLFSRILDCDGKTSNTMKYLELGAIPIRFLIMKRKILFLQYILKQDKKSMMYNILKAIQDKPMKNDFVSTCKKYMETLKINSSFKEIEKMSKFQLRRILMEKIKNEALAYLRNQQLKQEKIRSIVFNELKMQNYLSDGDRNIDVSKMIYKARGQTLDIKAQKRWKYEDVLCEGCHKNIESGEEVLRCENFGENDQQIEYSWFFSDIVSKQILAGKIMIKKLKKRKQIRDGIT